MTPKKTKKPKKPDWMGDSAEFIEGVGWYWVDPDHVPEVRPVKTTLTEDLALIKFDLQLIREKLGV